MGLEGKGAVAGQSGGQGRKGIDAFWLKIFAIVGMTLDHIGIVFGDHMPLAAKTALYALGGLTFPIMAYLLGEGFRHTRNVKKYALRLLFFAILTQIPYSWTLFKQANVLFTLLLGLLLLWLYERIGDKPAFYLLLIGVVLLSAFCDWGVVGPVMVFLYYILRGQGWNRELIPWLLPLLAMALPGLYSLVAQGDISVLPNIAFALVGCSLTVPLLHAYNGQRGRSMKYLFYAYYPVHIAVLGLLRGLLFGQWL